MIHGSQIHKTTMKSSIPCEKGKTKQMETLVRLGFLPFKCIEKIVHSAKLNREFYFRPTQE